jgi:muconate cycloisomerase
MKITRVDTIEVQLPNRWAGYGWHGLQIPIGNYLILRIETDTGLIGLGEAPALPDWGGERGCYYGEDPKTAAHIISRYFKPLLVGSDPRDISALLARLDTKVRGHMCAKSAVDLALHDLAGQAAGIPVYQLLGGAMRRKASICHSIGIAAPEFAAKEAAAAAAEGIQTMQIKVDGRPEVDLAVVGAIREAIGDEVDIFPDINQGYRSAKQAIRAVEAMSEFRICAVEQPVEGKETMARVTAAVDVPVWADESVWTPSDALETINKHSADAISIYYTKSGGLQRAMEIGSIAAASGTPVNVNGALETGVGNAGNLHLVAALRAEVMPSVIPVTNIAGRGVNKVGGVFYTDDIIKEPFNYEDGCLHIPDRPGLGIELDVEKLERYRVR